MAAIIAFAAACGTASSAQSQQASPCTPEGHRRQAEMQKQLNDWPNLARYRAANAKLAATRTADNRVVFMGDSITDNWDSKEIPLQSTMRSFPANKPYIGRGISGQTTPQMLVRFRQDVIELKPKVVLILAGINDIAGNTGPITLNETESNIASMAELARANGIGVVLCSVLPAKEFPWRPAIKDVSQKVKTLNAWIREYATRNGLTYLDYYTAMSDADGGLRPELAKDAVHPNGAGYQVMAPLAEAAIQKTLKAPARRKHL
jgi:lysophospholipase L1-like esterase